MMLFVNNLKTILRVEKQLLSTVTLSLRQKHYSAEERLRLKTDIENIICSPQPSTEEWNQVYDYFRTRKSGSKSLYYDILNVLKQVNASNDSTKPLRLYEYFLKNNHPMTLADQLAYLKGCFESRHVLLNTHKAEIERLYDDITTTYPYMDVKTSTTCLEALSVTKRWKEIIDILENNKNASYSPIKVYSCLIYAAFVNDCFDIGWKYFGELYDKDLFIEPYVLTDYIKICKSNKQTFKHNVSRMFEIWRDYGITPTKEVISEYVQTFRAIGLSAWYTTIFPDGNCERCCNKLKSADLPISEYEELAKTALDHVVVGKDIFIKSSPEEVTKFMKFIERVKPYDVVIDGLNLYYKYTKMGSIFLPNLTKTINSLKANTKRIVVVVRSHVNHNKLFMKLLEGTEIFYVKNQTQDDPFLLYAAILGGPNTKYISSDRIRDHKAILPNSKSRLTFVKWMLAQQYFIKTDGTLRSPSKYQQVANETNNIWHVPYRLDKIPAKDCILSHMPLSWVCFQFK